MDSTSPETDKVTAWIMQCGYASWHQRKAGHSYASSVVFTGTRQQAIRWAEDYRARHGGPCVPVRASSQA